MVAGGAGSGKTLFGLEFLVRGAQEFGEPGVLLSFEELAPTWRSTPPRSASTCRPSRPTAGSSIDAVHIDPTEIVMTGDFDLDGLFIRLDGRGRSVGTKRVVLDTIEVLFSAPWTTPPSVRAEFAPAAAVAEGPGA